MRGDSDRIADIFEALERIRSFTSGGRVQFFSDARTHEAVAYELLKLGEAAGRVSQPYRRNHTKVPWSRLIQLRHEVVHEYFRLDLDTLWEFIETELDPLERALRALPLPKS